MACTCDAEKPYKVIRWWHHDEQCEGREGRVVSVDRHEILRLAWKAYSNTGNRDLEKAILLLEDLREQ